MSGTMNPAVGIPYGGSAMATMTPQQLAQMRQMMFAQALMNQAEGPQRSPYGAVNQAISPAVGAAMYNQLAGAGGIGRGFASAPAPTGTWGGVVGGAQQPMFQQPQPMQGALMPGGNMPFYQGTGQGY